MNALRVDVVSLFPEAVDIWCQTSIVGRARKRGLLSLHCHDPRRFSGGRHRVVDDRPYGGGPGMVLAAPPIARCLDHCLAQSTQPLIFAPTPQGQPLQQAQLRDWSQRQHLIFCCGHYEGIDERIFQLYPIHEFSIGDFVVSGGELPALVAIDGVTRLLPGALGDAASAVEDSFSDGELDHPSYTRPPSFRGLQVPEVLLSGDHQRISAWRQAQRQQRTRDRRPDLGLPPGVEPSPGID